MDNKLNYIIIISILITFLSLTVYSLIRLENKDQYITCSECKSKVNFTKEIAPLFENEVIVDRNLNYHSIKCKCGKSWIVKIVEE